jgi:hypothetical protein
MTKLHVNSFTGQIAECQAVDSCLFGSAESHYVSIEEARAALLDKQGIPVFILTKADAKKLYPRYYVDYDYYVSADLTLKHRGENFVRSLEDQNYTVAGKKNTVEYIYRYLNELYKRREVADSESLYARAQYNALTELLGKYGIVRAPRDELDDFIQEALPKHRFRSDQILELEEELELENEIELAEATLQSFQKDPLTWNHQDQKLVAEKMSGHINSKVLELKEVEASVERYVEMLRKIKALETFISVRDSMPQEAQDIMTVEELEKMIKKLSKMRVFPESYYEVSRYQNERPSFTEILATATERLPEWLKDQKDKLAMTEAYYSFMEELSARSKALYSK